MNRVKDITRLSIVAALYIALTWLNLGYSYGYIQFRISEVLVLLCFYRKDYCISLIIGCFIANLFSTLGILDMIFGTLATALSVILISYSKRLFIASLYPVLFNGTIIGTLIFFTTEKTFSLLIYMGFVALGEFVIVSVIGFGLFKTANKNKFFLEVIEANQNID